VLCHKTRLVRGITAVVLPYHCCYDTTHISSVTSGNTVLKCHDSRAKCKSQLWVMLACMGCGSMYTCSGMYSS
jgi:hypothetical protein